MTWRRMGQFSSAGSIKLKKYGVIARASLVLASCVPAYSSGVSVGIRRVNWLRDVMRFLSCHVQLFQSLWEMSAQNPLPADRNSFNSANCSAPEGPSSSDSLEFSSCIMQRTIGLNRGV